MVYGEHRLCAYYTKFNAFSGFDYLFALHKRAPLYQIQLACNRMMSASSLSSCPIHDYRIF